MIDAYVISIIRFIIMQYFFIINLLSDSFAPSYEVDGICGRSDPMPDVPILLYIGKRGKVTEKAIGLTDYVPSLLHDMRNRLILTIVQIHPPWFALIFTLVDRVSPCGPPP
jgi:hypothetical protein